MYNTRFLDNIRVIILAEESLGVRSMATFIETPDISVLLDAGVSLAPLRYGLPPHPVEFKAVKEARERILEYASQADIVTISHYHLDHYTPPFTSWFEWTNEEIFREVYEGKIVLIKSPEANINPRQLRRAHSFLKAVKDLAKEVVFCDGKKFKFLATDIEFSEPLPHGRDDSKLGWVLVTSIKYGKEEVVYAPDVQGPISQKTLDYILKTKADLLIIGGPPLYLVGHKDSMNEVCIGMKNLAEIAKKIPVTIIAHHLLRLKEWEEKSEEVLVSARERKHLAITAAQYMGFKNRLLEAFRKELYEREPPSESFLKWVKNKAERISEPPPI